eukprot:541040-Prorocentrum_lima.AAC.1
MCVDGLLQAGNTARNLECLKALKQHWKMPTPEHLGPQDPDEKLKFMGVMVTRAKANNPECLE